MQATNTPANAQQGTQAVRKPRTNTNTKAKAQTASQAAPQALAAQLAAAAAAAAPAPKAAKAAKAPRTAPATTYELTPKGAAFEGALQASGFFWPLLKTVNLVGGLSLLLNIAPALGLALLAPVIAVIVLFHFTINPVGIPVAVILIVTSGLLLWAWRDRYAAMLKPA